MSMDRKRSHLDSAFEGLAASCMVFQDALYEDGFDSPEAISKFREDVHYTLKEEVATILERLDKYLTALDKETIM